MSTPLPNDERLSELLADRALHGLSEAEQAELQSLLDRHGLTGEEDAFDRAAAAAHLAMSPDPEPMPASLRRRLEAAADEFQTGGAENSSYDSRTSGLRPSWRYRIGWLAAACLFLAILAWWPRLAPPAEPTVVRERDRLIQSAPDLLRLTWGDFNSLDEAKAPPEIKGVKGEVVWSDREQRGFLTFQNLPVNDPGKEQYQLWIVDATRGLSQRVDGGVFDASRPGEIIIPITPKLRVHAAAGFAVTIEKPSGVVVSDMARRVVLALKS